jgi:hypothetical protein
MTIGSESDEEPSQGDAQAPFLAIDPDRISLAPGKIVLQQTAGGGYFCVGLGSAAAFLRAIDDGDELDHLPEDMEAGSRFFDSQLWQSNDPFLRRLHAATALAKAGFDPNQPRDDRGRWTSEGVGAGAANEAKEATAHELKRLKALRAFRAAIGAAMVLITTAPLESVPGVDVAATVRAAVELGRIAIELGNDEREINRAIEFVQKGPYTLDELRVDEDDVSFSSFDAFRKITPAELIVRRYPMTEFGSEYHHIVEKGGDNAKNFSQEQLHSTRNIIPLPGPLHDLVSAEYSKEYDDSGKTVREWLSGQSFEAQWNEGVKILRELGIVK